MRVMRGPLSLPVPMPVPMCRCRRAQTAASRSASASSRRPTASPSRWQRRHARVRSSSGCSRRLSRVSCRRPNRDSHRAVCTTLISTTAPSPHAAAAIATSRAAQRQRHTSVAAAPTTTQSQQVSATAQATLAWPAHHHHRCHGATLLASALSPAAGVPVAWQQLSQAARSVPAASRHASVWHACGTRCALILNVPGLACNLACFKLQ